jgi:hypothetical protein
MPAAQVIYFWAVAASPILLGLALVWVLLRKAASRDSDATDVVSSGADSPLQRVEPPPVAQRREIAVQLAIGLGLTIAGGLAGWAYVATALHGG